MKHFEEALAVIEDPVAPSRGRGLKLRLHGAGKRAFGRPFTGAWIETIHCTVTRLGLRSPLHGGVD